MQIMYLKANNQSWIKIKISYLDLALTITTIVPFVQKGLMLADVKDFKKQQIRVMMLKLECTILESEWKMLY